MIHLKNKNWIFLLFLMCFANIALEANSNTSKKTTEANNLSEEMFLPAPPVLHFCVGQPIVFNIVPEGVAPFSYQWYKNGLPLTDSINNSLSINYAELTHSGDYYCLITDNNSCSKKSTELTISVTDNPVVSVSGDSAAFLGETVMLTATGATNYNWANLSVPPSTITAIIANQSLVNVTPVATGIFDYEVIGTNSDGCSSRDTFALRVENCGNIITDNDGNTYATKAYNHVCWFLSNFKGTTYSDGTAIETALIYETDQLAPTQVLDVFGRLYDWSSAIHDDSYNAPTTFPIQGVCPTGWEIPYEQDFVNLLSVPHVNSTYDLRATNFWIDNNGTNLVNFNILPAGYYNDDSHRFENIYGATYFVTADSYIDSQTLHILACMHDCPDYIVNILNIHNAFSIRCVKRL